MSPKRVLEAIPDLGPCVLAVVDEFVRPIVHRPPAVHVYIDTYIAITYLDTYIADNTIA